MILVMIPDLAFVQAVVDLRSNVLVISHKNLEQAIDNKFTDFEARLVRAQLDKSQTINGWYITDAKKLNWVQIEVAKG